MEKVLVKSMKELFKYRNGTRIGFGDGDRIRHMFHFDDGILEVAESGSAGMLDQDFLDEHADRGLPLFVYPNDIDPGEDSEDNVPCLDHKCEVDAATAFRHIGNCRGPLSHKLRFEILHRDGFRCQTCGGTPKDRSRLEVDHRLPVKFGGVTEPSNLWTLCRSCNRGKGTIILQ